MPNIKTSKGYFLEPLIMYEEIDSFLPFLIMIKISKAAINNTIATIKSSVFKITPVEIFQVFF